MKRATMFVAAALSAIVGHAAGAGAQVVSTSTTTTVFTGTTTTTMFVPVDVTGGGQFEGGFPRHSFDAWAFTLDEPRVLVVEVSNGVGGCPGDSFVELRRPGAPGNCNGIYGDELPCIAFDDDSGPSVCSLLVKKIVSAGEYEIRVSAYDGASIPRYFLDVSFEQTECGNGLVEPSEQCDDGNVAAGDCCSPACTKDPAGTGCSDGLFCNGADTCSPAGTCTLHAGDPCSGPDGDSDCTETCNESADACSGSDPDGTRCEDGLFCNGLDFCLAGACTVHEGDPCAGPDGDQDCSEKCSEASDACTANDPDASPCDDGIFCNGSDMCLAGACSQHGGNPCDGPDGDLDCSETCNEAAGACSGADPNGSPCEDGLACNGADTCANGLCNAHQTSLCAGADADSDCAESCSDVAPGCGGNDPQGAPCDDGIFCNGADFCSNGSCSVHAGNPCPGPDGDSDCAESCNESSDACTSPDPPASACDDGVFCNGADTCSGGACTVHSGNPCEGADGDANCSESCSETADACTRADPNGSACNDGLFCNGADTCVAGFCSGHAGDPCPGPDGDGDCTERCNEAADACSGADPNGSACNDGLFCNGADACLSGACSQHAGNPCDGADGDVDCSEGCNEAADDCSVADANGSACNDGVWCNGEDACSAGSCLVHAGNPCIGPDGDANCSESCSEATETCTAPDINGSVCNDGLFCNGADRCSSGSCSQHLGNACPGPDGDANCKESCDEASDGCTGSDADGSPCNDGLFCNGPDLCAAGSCTFHAGNPCPGADGDADCSESCNEVPDTCTANDPGGAACDDGLFCNGADSCSAGFCSVHQGNPCPAADGDIDCSESCSEAADACTAADSDGAPCNDGVFCNGADTCAGGLCSGHAGNPCPGADGDTDCTETCDETADTCTAADPDASLCNDGLFCNGTDRCTGGTCSLHAGDPCGPPDADANCSESCAEESDSCTAADPSGSPCNDGLFCNGADSCAGGACSQHQGDPCAGADGDVDCSETCSETARACTGNDPDGSPCQDGLACNGNDTCIGGLCNEHESATCAGADGDGDCSESCSDPVPGCTHPDPAGSPCDDGIFCNGADSCSNGTCSVHDGNPCAGPDGDADCTESCDEQTDSCDAPDPAASACDDGVFCNGADSCAAGACTQHAGDPCQGPDGDADCNESCDETYAACSAPDAGGAPCSDGLFCTGADTCQSGACTGHAGDPCPGPDGDADCSESCSEASDDCSADDASGAPCSDGLFCGDVGGDGEVKAADALLVLRAAVGGNQCSQMPCVCDANGNGALSATDALIVLRAAVGAPADLDCPC